MSQFRHVVIEGGGEDEWCDKWVADVDGGDEITCVCLPTIAVATLHFTGRCIQVLAL